MTTTYADTDIVANGMFGRNKVKPDQPAITPTPVFGGTVDEILRDTPMSPGTRDLMVRVLSYLDSVERDTVAFLNAPIHTPVAVRSVFESIVTCPGCGLRATKGGMEEHLRFTNHGRGR